MVIVDPAEAFYALGLEKRYDRLKEIGVEASDVRRRVLERFRGEMGGEASTPEELTAELKVIMPSFSGKVIGRLIDSNLALHYIVSQEDMGELFGELGASGLGMPVRYTGKLIGEKDEVLREGKEYLSGAVILQGNQPTATKNRQAARHELYHSRFFTHPNLQRIIAYNTAHRTQEVDNETLADLLIRLNEAIILDEVGAEVEAYGVLTPGAFEEDFIEDAGFCARLGPGFALGRLRGNRLFPGMNPPKVGQATVARITDHEMRSGDFARMLFEETKKLAGNLVVPHGVHPIHHALTYVPEALQVLTFAEVEPELVRFCKEVMERDRVRSG